MNNIRQQSQAFSLFIIGILFFVFGFITWINSQLIPFLKQVCELKTDTQAYLVTFAFFISYFVMSIPSSYILKKTGFAKGIALGLLIIAGGSLLFIPAAKYQVYALFLIALFIQGAGLTLMQAASNPYVVILGPSESAARRISFMGICNKVAGMVGVFIFGAILFSNMESISANLNHLTGDAYQTELHFLYTRLIAPYIAIAVVLFLLALMVMRSNLPEIKPDKIPDDKPRTSIFSYTYLWMGILAIFAYVGAEVIAIDTLSLYGDFHGFSHEIAKNFSIMSLIALTVGYLTGIIFMPKYISQRMALMISCLLALALVSIAIVAPPKLSIFFIILLSFAHAMMWPCIWPLSIEGLGKYTKLGSAFLVMAIAGGAVLPLVYGSLAGMINRQNAYCILIPLYLYILYFSLFGYKINKHKTLLKMKYRKYLCLIFLGLSLMIFSSELSAQDSIYARNVIKTLASPAFKGRGYAFKGDSIAASFISKEFERFNLNRWTENYYQTYYVSINVFEGNKEVNFGKNYSSSTCSDALQIAAYSAPAKGRFSIIPATKKMLTNKWDISKTKDKFIAIDMTKYASDKEKREQWNRTVQTNSLQAGGYILLNKQLPSYSPGRGRIKSSHTVITILKDSISGKLKDVDINLDARFIERYQTQNVCGYVEGKLYPDTFFVIGAHYDHLGQIGTDYIFHGANDNASGTAMMMDLARHFSLPENKPDYSIAFVAFSGEEIGLLGSFNFVENTPIPLKNIKMMLNLDMVGTGEDGFTFICGKTFPDEFDKFVSINNQKNYTPQLVAREETANSDHYPFFKGGCKAMFVFSMGGKAGNYHHPSDIAEKLSMGGYKSLAGMIIEYINLHNRQ